MKRIAEMTFTLLLLILFAFLFVVTWYYPYRARLVPLIFLSLGLVLLSIHLFKRYYKLDSAEEKTEEERGGDSEIDAPFDQEMKVLGWFIMLLAVLWAFGFLVGVPFFFITFLRWWAKERWTRVLSIAGIFTVLMYFVVEVGFRIILYRGWVFD